MSRAKAGGMELDEPFPLDLNRVPSHYFEGCRNRSPGRPYLVSNFVRLLRLSPVFVAGPGWDTCSPACRVVEVEDVACARFALGSNC